MFIRCGFITTIDLYTVFTLASITTVLKEARLKKLLLLSPTICILTIRVCNDKCLVLCD